METQDSDLHGSGRQATASRDQPIAAIWRPLRSPSRLKEWNSRGVHGSQVDPNRPGTPAGLENPTWLTSTGPRHLAGDLLPHLVAAGPDRRSERHDDLQRVDAAVDQPLERRAGDVRRNPSPSGVNRRDRGPVPFREKDRNAVGAADGDRELGSVVTEGDEPVALGWNSLDARGSNQVDTIPVNLAQHESSREADVRLAHADRPTGGKQVSDPGNEIQRLAADPRRPVPGTDLPAARVPHSAGYGVFLSVSIRGFIRAASAEPGAILTNSSSASSAPGRSPVPRSAKANSW